MSFFPKDLSIVDYETSQINLNGSLAPMKSYDDNFYFNRKLLLQKNKFSKLDKWFNIA